MQYKISRVIKGNCNCVDEDVNGISLTTALFNTEFKLTMCMRLVFHIALVVHVVT